MVEPIHPFERGDFDGLEGPPWPTAIDDLGLVEAVDGLGERIVIAVADAADRWFDAGFGQALSVFYGNVLLGFNRSSQQSCELTVCARQMPRQVFSSQVFYEASC